jgi:hypothetical protein
MKIKFLPKTYAGKWSVGLFIVFIALAVSVSMVPESMKAPDFPNPLETPLFAGLIYLHFAAAIGASMAGLRSVIKNNERSILVFISIPLGMIYIFGIIVVLIGLIISLVF